jgi:beta-glucosidase
MVTKMACSDSPPFSDAFTPGYTVSSAIAGTAQSDVTPMSLASQAALMRGSMSGCGGSKNYSSIFSTPGASPVPGWKFRDGPRGVCLRADSTVGLGGGNYSTTFPSGSARGASFDLALEEQVGAAMGDEMVSSGHNMILAPVINILRHPAWGRAQETYGEDSFHLGRMGSAYVTGVQQYVAACVKHFAAYNIENGRDTGNISVLDEQTAYEVYGRHFEMVVQDAGVACVMAAYNLIQIGNGPAANCTSSKALLTDMLRTTFGFKGFVLSDWWAMPGGQNCPSPALEGTYTVAAVNAGLDMELPWNMNFSQLEAAVTAGTIPKSAVTASATRIATQALAYKANVPGLMSAKSTYTAGSNSITSDGGHSQLAYQSAAESMVLLKNDKNTLPIPSSAKRIAVIGATVPFVLTTTDIANGTINFATEVRTGDLGSSRTYPDPANAVGPLAGIKAAAPAGATVTQGATAADAANADFVVVVAGLTYEDEGEGYTSSGDRTSFSLDDKNINVHKMAPVQNPLIAAVAALGKPMVVVLEGGSVIDMPWLSQVPAVVMAWYPGEAGGKALGDLLFGKVNFSGKLPVTWPKAWADEPLFTAGVNKPTTMGYFLGYRYFDAMATTPLFAFGHGLSYATFSYSNLQVPCSTVTQKSVVDVQVDVTNTGSVDGDEITFLFVSFPSGAMSTPRRSVKELKGFHRTTIPAGKTVRIHIPLPVAILKYWDQTNHKWAVESGVHKIMVGGSSDALTLTDTLTVN